MTTMGADCFPKIAEDQLLNRVTNPLSLLLIVLATISLLTGSPTAAFIISMMVIFGGLLRFFREFQSNKAAEKLQEMVSAIAFVAFFQYPKSLSL